MAKYRLVARERSGVPAQRLEQNSVNGYTGKVSLREAGKILSRAAKYKTAIERFNGRQNFWAGYEKQGNV